MPQLETVLDSALLTAKVFQACSEVPVLQFLKPAACLAIIICETAKENILNVTGNVEAAKQLSERTANILDLVVDHLRQIPLTEVTPDLERDAVNLYETLENVNRHITKLRDRKRNLYAWVWAYKDKEDLSTLQRQLNEVLVTFGVSRTLSIGRKIVQVQGMVREAHQDVKLVLSRVDARFGLPRVDQPRVIHRDYVCRGPQLSKYIEYLPTSGSAYGDAVTEIRLYKATYHEPHGEAIPIMALDYDNATPEKAFVIMCQLHRKMRTSHYAQVCGTSACQQTLYFFSSVDCLPLEQVMTQASEEEVARRLSQLSEAMRDVSTYLWKEPTPLLMSAAQCVLQDDKVVLMDIPTPVQSHHQRAQNDRVVTDIEISLGDNRTRTISIETYNDFPHSAQT